MSLDIRNGDTLIVGNKRYPISRSAGYLNARVTPAFRRSLVNTCTIVRSIKGTDTTVFSGKCTVLDPVDPETRKRMLLETPHSVLQTFIAGSAEFEHLFVEDLNR
jgi:hypothetical protein